jgi:hypothetical protein
MPFTIIQRLINSFALNKLSKEFLSVKFFMTIKTRMGVNGGGTKEKKRKNENAPKHCHASQ